MATADVQNEMLQCSVCIDVFTDPRTLPCLHTFCLKCIADWCKDKKPGNKMACPECRQEFVIPYGGIHGLKKNFFIESMLNLNEVKQKTNRMCEVCPGPKKKTSQMFCLQCEQSYCESCSDFHLKIKLLSSHELVSLNELQSGVDVHKKCMSSFCDEHTDKSIDLFCLDHNVAICSMCFFHDHRSHHCEEIKKIVAEFHDEKCKKDLQTAINEVEENLGTLNSRKLSFFDQVKNVETKISEEADKRIQMIINHKQKLISELQDIKTNYEKEVVWLTRELINAKSRLTRFDNHCNELLKGGSDIVICQEESSLRKRIEELVNVESLKESLATLGDTNVTFSPSSLTFDDHKSILGQVEGDNPRLLVTLSNPPVSSNGRIGAVAGVTMSNNFVYVVYDYCNKVEVFDCENHYSKVKDIEVEGLKQARDIVASSVTSQLFITDSFNFNALSDTILRVDLKTGVTDVFIKPGSKFIRLSLVENRLLVSTPYTLVTYDIGGGNVLNRVQLINNLEYCNISNAFESNRDSYFLCGSHEVFEIDRWGHVIRSFDDETEHFSDCYALNSAGRLLYEFEQNIALLDDNFKHKRIIIDKNRLDENPCKLYYDKNSNRLVVGLVNGHVSIFEFNGN